MGNSASSLPYSIDNQVGAPHDHNGWALHEGKSTDGNHTPVSVFVGKKPLLVKTPVSSKNPTQMQLVPASHHYNHCRKLRHPHILKVYATLDTDNPAAASSNADGGAGVNSPAKPSTSSSSASSSGGGNTTTATTGDLIVVTEPCISLTQWLLQNPTPEQLAWGLECIVQGLHFLHHSANLSHGNITPSSLYVTQSGDIKLWNFNIITPIGPNHVGPTPHFQQWEAVCTQDAYRSPERINQQWDMISTSGGVHAIDSYSLAILIDYMYQGRVPPPLQKAVQRMQTPNIKMRPRLQPLLKCPVFDTPYQKLQLQLQDVTIQPVEQKVMIWQNLGQQLQHTTTVPKDVALYKILPLIISSIQIICNNESMLGQDMYRREVLAMLVPLFYIEEQYQDPSKIGKELAPLISKLFHVPDRGVRSILLNQVGFMTLHLDKNALNANVFEPLCSGFNDSSPALRELTLKATLGLVPSLTPPSLEKLSRYLVRLQSDAETSIRTNAVIFIAKIAPHLSEVSKEKMLLPAYARAMKDMYGPCRLAALQSTLQSKQLFAVSDLATKVLPCVMPLLLDPLKDVRDQAFRVVHTLLHDIQEESKRMELIVPPGGVGSGQSSQPPPTAQRPAVPSPGTTNGTSSIPQAPSSGSTYLSGLSSWMSTSTQPSTTTTGAQNKAVGTTPTPQMGVAQATRPTYPPQQQQQQQQYSQAPLPPVQKFAATSLNPTITTPTKDDGWGDEADVDDDTDNWGDDDDDGDKDDNLLAFSNIGTKAKTTAAAAAVPPHSFTPAATTATPASFSGFSGMGDDDDPFASIGMKSASIMPRPAMRGTSGSKLVIPKKTVGPTSVNKGKIASPPATKLKMEDNDAGDGWDDF